MKAKIAAIVLIGAVLGLIIYGGTRWPPATSGRMAAQEAVQQSHSWRPASRRLVALMIEKYGPPSRISAERVVWGRRGPWKRIAVSRASARPLEQVVEYAVPESRSAQLRRFGRGLTVIDPAKGELGAASDRESRNVLALNLAYDIATGRRTPEQAGRFYDSTLRLAAAGKSSPYLERLMFPTAEREYYPYTRPPF
ncbi:MAG: hypothetical protein PHF00_01905 [Elusimicrobia bacterium]|nr:hypothetical protein [Elusimicrobiota bacterium]